MISLAFAILFYGGISKLFSLNFAVIFTFIITLGISALTVGISFLLHELMHKYMSQKYRLWAEFRAFYPGLWFALVGSLFGFIFAAPGAVISRSYQPLSRGKRGKISLAGPLTNIILSFLFFPGAWLVTSGYLGLFFRYGLTINSLLAAFNLIPAGPFDGREVYLWNKPVYFVALAIALLLFISTFLI
jgi:Zn-dependent protease